MRRLLLALTVFASVAMIPPAAVADGNDSLNESFRVSLRGGGIASEGAGLSMHTGGPASATIQLSSVPAGATVHHARLYWAVLAGDDAQVQFAGQSVTGQMIGRSPETCWFDNNNRIPAEDNRVYRADVTNMVTGNGSFTIAGVGVGTGALVGDGQGASLVVVYSQSDALYESSIVLTDGAVTGGYLGHTINRMYQSFFGLEDERVTQGLTMHVGIGDTQPEFATGAMRVGGVTVLPPNQFSGSDGASWDDHTIALQPSLLPPNTFRLDSEIDVVDDCMVWTYAGIEVRRALPPVVITSPASNDVVGTTPTIIGVTIGDDANAVRLSEGTTVLATTPVTDGGWAAQVSLPGGRHTITATGLDAGGNPIPKTSQVTFDVDAQAPDVEVTSPRLVGTATGNAVVRGSALDNFNVARVLVTYEDLVRGASVTVQANCFGCGGTAASWEARAGLQIGPHRVTATAVDGVGNERTTPPITFIVNAFPG